MKSFKNFKEEVEQVDEMLAKDFGGSAVVTKFKKSVESAEAAHKKSNIKMRDYHLKNAQSSLLGLKSSDHSKLKATDHYDRFKKMMGINEEVEQVDENIDKKIERLKKQYDHHDVLYGRAQEARRNRGSRTMSPREEGLRNKRNTILDQIRDLERQKKESSIKQNEEVEHLDEAARGERHMVHCSYDDKDGNRASMNYHVHAPHKEAAKRYAERDLTKAGRKNVKAHSAKLMSEEVQHEDAKSVIAAAVAKIKR